MKDNLFIKKVPLYYDTDDSQLIVGDSFKVLTRMKSESVDMIFADPPYFLSNDGITCKSGKMVSVNKGSWISFQKKEVVLKKNISLTENGLNYVKRY